MTRETELDDLLAEAGRRPMAPSDAFLARVLADAEALQPAPPAALPARAPVRRPGIWSRLVAGFGGGGALAGLGTAAIAGLAFGFLQPSLLSVVSGGYLTLDTSAAETATDSSTLFPDMTLFLTEDQG